MVTTFPSGNWMESVVSSSKQAGELTDTNAYLVIFSDDGRTAANQSYLGKVVGSSVCVLDALPPTDPPIETTKQIVFCLM